jgi:hypothetical protein
MSHLTEPTIRAFCLSSLQACKDAKMKYYTRVVNLSLLVAFVTGFGLILYFKYKGRRTPAEKKQKEETDRLHILTRIKQIQIEKRKDTNLIITDVPRPGDFF